MIIFLLLFLIPVLFFSQLFQVQIDDINGQLILVYRKYVISNKVIKYNLKDIEFTYKYQAVSLRSSPKNTCTIYFSDKPIATLIPNRDGWDDSEINDFVSELIKIGIKRKFVGHSLRDVDP